EVTHIRESAPAHREGALETPFPCQANCRQDSPRADGKMNCVASLNLWIHLSKETDVVQNRQRSPETGEDRCYRAWISRSPRIPRNRRGAPVTATACWDLRPAQSWPDPAAS